MEKDIINFTLIIIINNGFRSLVKIYESAQSFRCIYFKHQIIQKILNRNQYRKIIHLTYIINVYQVTQVIAIFYAFL